MSFLPGMFPAGAAAAVLTRLAAVASTTNTSSTTITGPAEIQSGDLLVLCDNAGNSSGGNPSEIVPSGFSIAQSNTFTITAFGFDCRKIISYKIADGSEASASLTGMSGNAFTAKLLYVFRGNRAIDAAVSGSANFQFTSGTPTNQTVTSGSGNAPLIVMASYGSDGTIDPRGFSPTKDGEINPDVNNYLAYLVFDVGDTLSDVTVSMQDEGSGNHMASCYIECS